MKSKGVRARYHQQEMGWLCSPTGSLVQVQGRAPPF